MNTIARQSSLGLIAIYIGIVLGFVNVLLIMPALLSAEEIGLINLIFSVVMLIYPLMNFSATQILKRYFTHVKDRQEIFNFSFLISCFGAIFFAFLFYFGEPIFIKYYKTNSPEILSYFWWIYVVCIMMSWTDIATSYATVQGRFHLSAFSREIFYRLGIMFSLGVLFVQWISFSQYIYIHYILYGLSGLLIILLLFRQGLFRVTLRLPPFSRSVNKSIFKYGSFTVFIGLASVIAVRIDLIMLGSMEGLKDVGIYTIAMFMATVIEVPRRSVLQSSEPIIRMAIKENDIRKAAQIHYKTILNLLFIGGLLLVVLASNLNSIYSLIPNGEVYKQGFWVVLFIGMAKISEIFGGSIQEIILSSRYYIVSIVFIVLLAVSTISLNYYLIPIYGLNGAAVSTLISAALIAIIKNLIFKFIFKEKVYNYTIVAVILFYTLLGAGLFYIPSFSFPVFSIILKCTIAGLSAFLFLKWTRISPDLNQLINQILSQVKMDKWIKL